MIHVLWHVSTGKSPPPFFQLSIRFELHKDIDRYLLNKQTGCNYTACQKCGGVYSAKILKNLPIPFWKSSPITKIRKKTTFGKGILKNDENVTIVDFILIYDSTHAHKKKWIAIMPLSMYLKNI